MTYKTEFPKFDNGDAFEAMAVALTPYGFKDGSWHNDANPSLMAENTADSERYLQVYVTSKDDIADGTFAPFGIWNSITDVFTDYQTLGECVADAIKLLPALDATTGGCGDPIDWHEQARAFMDRNAKPEWQPMSLDEWLIEYADGLPDDIKREGAALLSNFSGYGGDA